MRQNSGSIIFAALLFTAAPAQAFDSPINRGPLADFLNVFREQAIPRKAVYWRHPEFKRGTVVISTKDRRLYYVLGDDARSIWRRRRPNGLHLVGRENDFAQARVAGLESAAADSSADPICRAIWRRHGQSAWRARIFLGSSQYRIHGSNEPDTIGAAVSSGCIRMTN